MRFTAILAFSVLLLTLRDSERDKPATPAQQYQALVKEYDQARQEYAKASREAKTDEERNQIAREKFPKVDRFTGRFLELAQKHPKDPAACDALAWIIKFGSFQARKDAAEAAEVLRNDYVKDPRMAQLCRSLPFVRLPKETEKLLQAVLEKNPDHEAQGAACFLLARYREMEARIAERQAPGGAVDKLRPEADQLFDRLVREYTDVAWVRQRALAVDPLIPAALIRTALEKTPERQAKGKGYHALGKRLKEDAERAAQHGKASAADQLNHEAEQVWERVAKEYADVTLDGTRKLGDLVKGDLYELRHLVIGKQALEIEGEDIDGKKFKLSNYRGKVVLLDFWGHW